MATRSVALTVLTVATIPSAGCGDVSGPSDNQVPARDLSLAELVRHGPPPVENIVPLRHVPRLFADLERQVATGERSRVDADRLLAARMRGELERLPDPLRDDKR